jgi:Na+/phosphate symporter
VSVNLTAIGQERLAERVDLAPLRDESTSKFARFVIDTLQETVASLGDANTADLAAVAARKAEMKSLTSAARKSVLDRLKLADVQDVVRIRLADDLIEQLRQIGRLSLRIAKKYAAPLAADPDPG